MFSQTEDRKGIRYTRGDFERLPYTLVALTLHFQRPAVRRIRSRCHCVQIVCGPLLIMRLSPLRSAVAEILRGASAAVPSKGDYSADWTLRVADPDCDQCEGRGYIFTGGTPIHAPEKAWCPICYPEAWREAEFD